MPRRRAWLPIGTASCSRRGGARRSRIWPPSSAAPEAAIAVACDVTEWDQVEALAARALEEFGRIDAVFANAGFGATRGFLEESPEHWRSMVLDQRARARR